MPSIWLLICSQVFILYHTATRGAILGLIGGLLLVAILNVKNSESAFIKKTSIIMLSVIVLIVGGFFLVRNTSVVQNSPVLSRFSSLTPSELKTQGRYFVWPMAIEGIKDNPILGWGQENFGYVFQEYYKPEMFSLEPWFDRAHNVFLDWAIVGGILGLFSYLSLYIVGLYLLWKSDLPHIEKSILTGLIAAYFFHNFFVFDNLISYILFFSLLAYIHVESNGAPLWQKTISEEKTKRIFLPAISIFALLILYFVNVKPLIGNIFLIDALKHLQIKGGELRAAQDFEKAYSFSRLGRQEAAERITATSVQILSSTISVPEKNAYFAFAKDAVVNLTLNKEFEKDARYQLTTGSFITNFGLFDEALTHLERARQLMPNKQQVYFEIGAAYIGSGDTEKALESFKYAYELAPDYEEAKIIYLIGAIYAKDRTLENKLISELPKEIVAKDSRIATAYKV